ncbi:AraC family transcriptional regulator [Pseudonocardia sp. DSM 110487]|uniref:AraC family transcriptional regulator n=1 Tax=Pseudonocardia sp. DSM 110487 TaxID=2865833 RepID=UPI001C6A8DCF|nr:AraC family transcriptional regulator [Pseudonocardia sp. DSM 110487]QYN37909.1 AraC family transcriptional regulator [Pseudonocardia sp. DSM 110487]
MTVTDLDLPAVPSGSGDAVADIVADVVATVRRGSPLYCVAGFRAPWAIGLEEGGVAGVTVITSGTCWLMPEGLEPVQLVQGDVVLLPSGVAHVCADQPGRAARPLKELIGGPLGDGMPRRLAIDGDGPVTRLLVGAFVLAPGPPHPLTAILPPVVHIGAGQARDRGLAAAVELLSCEVQRADPGAPAVVASLLDLLFVYILRAWLAEQHQSGEGWVRALYDPVVGSALALIHDDPARPWSVDLLARAAGAPRATFTRRFRTLTGQAPMAYVAAWRMSVAARLLREERGSLREVAHRVGYDSEFAFARAFKRTTGHPPGRFRTDVISQLSPGSAGIRGGS